MKTRVCEKCKVPKELEEFHKHKNMPEGRGYLCKPCGREKQQEVYWSDPIKARTVASRHRKKCSEKVNKYNREYLQNHPEKSRNWNEQNRARNLPTMMLVGARARAKRRGVPCTITKEDIIVPTHCPVFGVELKISSGSAGDWSPSLDCVIPEKGYIPGNIAVISHKANTMKSNGTVAELELLLAWMKSQTPSVTVPDAGSK